MPPLDFLKEESDFFFFFSFTTENCYLLLTINIFIDAFIINLTLKLKELFEFWNRKLFDVRINNCSVIINCVKFNYGRIFLNSQRFSQRFSGSVDDITIWNYSF